MVSPDGRCCSCLTRRRCSRLHFLPNSMNVDKMRRAFGPEVASSWRRRRGRHCIKRIPAFGSCQIDCRTMSRKAACAQTITHIPSVSHEDCGNDRPRSSVAQWLALVREMFHWMGLQYPSEDLVKLLLHPTIQPWRMSSRSVLTV
jgi:hypothetical protein